jgi:hypothetical protein
MNGRNVFAAVEVGTRAADAEVLSWARAESPDMLASLG